MTESRMNREYELKFKVRASDLDPFKDALRATFETVDAWTADRLSSRYFDTPGGGMAAKGIGIRLRRSSKGTVQTVKTQSAGAGGLMDRKEWEHPLTGDTLDFRVLPADARDAMGRVPVSELQEIIEVEVERETAVVRQRNLLGPDLIVEAALDRGYVAAGGDREHFAECELELLQGDFTFFLEKVAEVVAICPLALSNETKAARGYRLLGGGEPAARKAPKFNLSGKQSVDEALASIFSVCGTNIIDNESVCLRGRDPEGVHQMRVSVRRLRSSLNIFRPLMDAATFEWVADDLKWLGGRLGPARDWDVFLAETLESMVSFGIDEPSIRALREAAEGKRAAAYEQVRETLGSDRYAQLMFRLMAFTALKGWRASPPDLDDPLLKPLGRAARKILRRQYARLMKAAKGLETQDIEARHQVRIRVKKLRYAVDFLRGVYRAEAAEGFLSALRRLQDEFGHINDLAEAIRLTDALTDTSDAGTLDERVVFAAGQVRGWYARAMREAEPELLRNWDEFAATPPFWETKKRARKGK